MEYKLIGVGDFDPYCLNKVCAVQIAPAPTPAEQTELQEIAEAFFTERDKSDHHPRLNLVFQGTTVIFTQPNSTRKVDRNSFNQLLVRLGFKEDKAPQGNATPAAANNQATA